MATLNKVFLMGNLTRDAELRVLPKGTPIAQFGMAVSRKYKDDSGAEREDTTFVDVEAWGKQADLVAKYLTKGSPCLVEGRLKLDQWEDKTSGQKRTRLKVVMENVQFLGASKGKSEVSASESRPAPASPPPSGEPVDESSVPF